MQPFAVFALSALLVSLCAVFVFLGYGVFAGNRPNLPQPMVMTASAVVLLGVFLSSLFIGNQVIGAEGGARSEMAASPIISTFQSEELAVLASRIDQAAERIYSGLDTTQELIGKTAGRKQAIKYGRDQANEQLISLAERLRAALRGEEPLRLFDQRMARHIAGEARQR
jgi:hypothetical protein